MLDNELSPEARILTADILRGFTPPVDVTVAAWAEAHRIIPKGNAEPGAWSNSRVPYTVEPAEAVTDDAVHTIVVVGAAQSSKTAAIGENVVAHAACCDPCTIVWACPNEASSETAATRFDAMIAASPELSKRFGSRTARSRTNNTGLKEFEGGKLVLASAGSASSLASHPARIVVADEVDRFPTSLRKEGDPIAVVRARLTTFSRAKFIALSSPTQEGASRIEALHAEGDQREWMWQCECGGEHAPEWDHVEWTPNDPASARYVMPCCGLVIDDATRLRFMERGRWVPMAAGQPGVRSYRFRGLSSPWLMMPKLAAEFEGARGNPNKLAPFFNTRIGVAFDGSRGDGLDAETVKNFAEPYRTDMCPERAALITAAIDVQGGWLAIGIMAWGDADEGWLLQFHELPGDIKDPKTRLAAEELLSAEFKHPSGAVLPVEAVAIDSGYETTHVLEWSMAKRAVGKRWFATKGVAGWDRPLWARGGDVARSLSRIFLLGVDGGKQQITAGLAMADLGPGKIHMPEGLPDHVYEWAVNEEIVTRDVAGVPRREWRMKKGQRRNETYDVMVMSLAVKHSADFGIPARLERLASNGTIRPKVPTMKELAHRMAALTNGVNANV